MDELLREFLTETNESLDTVDVELVRFERDPNNAQILDNIFRLVHSIKGTCGFLDLPRLEALAHAAEALMGRFRDGMPVTSDAVTLILAAIDRIKEILAALESTEHEPEGADPDLIDPLRRMSERNEAARALKDAWDPRAPLASIDDLARAVRASQLESLAPAGSAEMAEEAHLHEAASSDDERESDPLDAKSDPRTPSQSIRVNVEALESLMTMVSELVLTRNQLLDIARRQEDSDFKAPLQRLSSVTAELQEGVMKARMQPIGNAWQKMPRIVRDLAAELGKEIDLQMLGSDTELDRQVLELIKDPLTHMVRNSADHGLEKPAERRVRGKPDKGTIRLSAYHEGGHIIIEIADDGRGLDTMRIRDRALASGLVSPAELEAMTESQVHKLIFAAGLSTADRVTEISGRGVGMDVVKTNIEHIGGAIDVKSVFGAGTSFLIKIPLTLAIVSALIVESQGSRYAIPQLAVIELVRAQSGSEHRIERIKDTPVLRLRDRLLPLVHLGQLLGTEVVDVDIGESGFIVVTQAAGHRFGIVVDSVFHTEEIVVKPLASRLRHIGMFSGNTILGDGAVILILDPTGIARAAGSGEAQVHALEDPAAPRAAEGGQTVSLLVFRAGSRALKAVPLALVTRLEEIDGAAIEVSNGREVVQYRGRLMPLVRLGDGVERDADGVQPVLVFSDRGRSMGLIVDEIVDIVEDRLGIELVSDTPGVIGSAIVRGKATEIVNVGHFLPLAFDDWMRRPESARAPRLLLVDNSAFFRSMLRPLVQAAGYDVVAASSGAEALAIVRDGAPFAAIISDVEMPGMTGLELAAALRENARTAHVPLIALSGEVGADMLDRVCAAGFDQLIAKFDRPGLIAALKAAAASLAEAA